MKGDTKSWFEIWLPLPNAAETSQEIPEFSTPENSKHKIFENYLNPVMLVFIG